MRFKQIQPYDKLKFFKKTDSKEEQDNNCFESEIVFVSEYEKTFVIHAPETDVTLFDKSIPLEFVVYTTEGAVSFDAIVLKIYEELDEYFFLVRVISHVVRAQLRAHKRINAEIPISFSIMKPGEKLSDEPETLLKGKTKDISSGGAKFLTSEKLDKKTRLRVVINMLENSLIAESIVLTQEEVADDEQCFETRVKFETLIENKRNIKRLYCNLPVKYSLLAANDKYTPGVPIPINELKTGEVKHISGGGLRFLGDSTLEVNARLNMIIEKPGETLLAEALVVVQRMLAEPDRGYIFETGVKFLSTSHSNRRFIRYPCFFDMKFLLVKEGEQDDSAEEPSALEGKVIDIGSGGLRFVSAHPVNENTKLRIVIQKPEGSVFAEGVAVQTSTRSFKYKGYTYETRVKFTSVKNMMKQQEV